MERERASWSEAECRLSKLIHVPVYGKASSKWHGVEMCKLKKILRVTFFSVL